ncbi:hypothetical protein K431DRAFT_288317 [Polychaeton citri CBS 116435]|uniref:N-acetyltransferase domain-containing protein n=1 Tax=Polychaeton citri CBS 116435 TaxID=1314669 RepID=A0A9P4PZA4_9PEZI|nr:hypothetical protein K431DRAFT_288317 [Polychaeton citri CBS 116435]
MAGKQQITVREATLEDLPTLETILPRSFHLVNPYIKKCFPDTAIMRSWWSLVFSEEIKSEQGRIFAAFVPTADIAGPSQLSPESIGVLCVRLMAADERSNGVYDAAPFTTDHDRVLCEPMFVGMSENRERLMLGRRHFLIELFGVDDRFKGQGVGGKLLREACRFADEAGFETFVQANGSAKAMYEKFGFVVKTMVQMPEKEGVGKYEEYMLVRNVGGKDV